MLLLPFYCASTITIIPLVTRNVLSFHSTSLQSTSMTAYSRLYFFHLFWVSIFQIFFTSFIFMQFNTLLYPAFSYPAVYYTCVILNKCWLSDLKFSLWRVQRVPCSGRCSRLLWLILGKICELQFLWVFFCVECETSQNVSSARGLRLITL